MPLNQSRLSAAIRANLLADEDSKVVDNEALTTFCNAVASAIITEITANAVVISVSFVTGPSGGPVTGTGSVQ